MAPSQKVQSTHLSWYIVEQLPVIPPTAYARAFGSKTAEAIVRDHAPRLSYTAWDLEGFARDMGHAGPDGKALPPFKWDENERRQLRARLDALYFILYGIIDEPTCATFSRPSPSSKRRTARRTRACI